MSETKKHCSIVRLDNITDAISVFGQNDENIKHIEEELKVEIIVRDNSIKIYGEKPYTEKAKSVFEDFSQALRKGNKIVSHDIRYAVSLAKNGEDGKNISSLANDLICITARGKRIRPKTLGQKIYADSIKKNDIVFGIGPAGTGKTYLAMALAISAFKNKDVNRIILTRPAVEAGERLGFLPGDLQEKVDPYLRPLYDALYDILGGDTYQKNMEKGTIEVAPLAYMRGRTLDDSFVILDEAQNTTPEQMKMFLTRLGFGSKAVITGDITQIDLPKGKFSGLQIVTEILDGIKGIKFVHLSEKDVIRHKLVQDIIKAYESFEEKTNLKN